MAGSRLERLGTIFSRVTALIRGGAMKKEERPLWYDVYRVFPPITEPSYANLRLMNPIKNIFYREDKIRAKFHQKMLRSLPAEDLLKETTTDVTRRAIDLTNKLMQENEKLTLDEAVDQMIDIFKKEGLFVVRRTTTSQRASHFSLKTVPEETKISNIVENFEQSFKQVSDKKIDIVSLLKDTRSKTEDS